MRTPSKFVGLHGHTNFSVNDGLGYPEDHFQWCKENGLDAHAITEHGNFNSYAVAQLYVENWHKTDKNNNFKYLPGIEAYFHPDLDAWKKDKEEAENAKSNKIPKKLQKEMEKLETKLLVKETVGDETESIEISNAQTIEVENESKSTKLFNPLNRRHHLVLLPKSTDGLLKLFGATSKAYMQGFYRYPRIDAKILKEAAKTGQVIALTACLAGLPSYNIFRVLQETGIDNLDYSLLDDSNLMNKCVDAVGNAIDLLSSCVGIENLYLELQFNKLPAQSLVNRAILEFAKRNDLNKQLVITCDSHYYRPEYWKERELYKALGFLNYKSYQITPESLPKSKEDLKCELYPKNADQLWNEYQLLKSNGHNFYNDEIICDAIERTYDIAHNIIGDIKPDRSPKFPNKKLVPQNEKSFNYLVKLCINGLKERGLDQQQEYVDRLKEELNVIKTLKNADYFISYQKIIELAKKVTLVAPGRGSGGGSLVAYVLRITDLDPIKWQLSFERFLTIYRSGAPDIDCINEHHLIMMYDKSYKKASNITIGDLVYSKNGPKKVSNIYKRKLYPGEHCLWVLVESENGVLGHVVVVPMHKFILKDGQIVRAGALRIGDKLLSSHNAVVKNIEWNNFGAEKDDYIDITVDEEHVFTMIPFDVIENGAIMSHERGYYQNDTRVT